MRMMNRNIGAEGDCYSKTKEGHKRMGALSVDGRNKLLLGVEKQADLIMDSELPLYSYREMGIGLMMATVMGKYLVIKNRDSLKWCWLLSVADVR